MINKRLFKEGSKHKLYVPINALSSLLNALLTIFNAYLLALTVNEVFINKNGLSEIKVYLMLFFLNAAFKSLFNILIDRYIRNTAENIKEEIREKAIKEILNSNPNRVKGQKQGEIINLLTEGVEMITPYYSQYMPQLFSSFLIPVAICISVAFVDKISAVIMIITYPIIPLFMILIGHKSKEKNERQWKKLEVLSSHFLDMLQGLRTLKSFGRSKVQEEKVYEISESYRKGTMDVLRVSFLSALVLELSTTISTAVVAVNLGLRLVYGQIEFLHAFFVLVLTPEFYLPLRQLGLKFHSSLNGQVAIERIEKLENSLMKESFLNDALPLEDNKFSIEVRNLSFSHDRSKETLNNISFKIEKGEKAALIGESGSGKTTLINILSGLIKVDDGMVFINGIDLNHIDKENYMKRVSIVPQFPHIFNMSIKDNVLLADKSVNGSELLNILEQTRVKDFAEGFNNSYETIVGEGESTQISGGEKQRIAAARALTRASDFVIFDEPTSALDPETEELMPKLIKENLHGRSVLIATHRLNTIKAVDKILVLNNGYLVESGSSEELMQLKGRYYSMIKSMEEKQ